MATVKEADRILGKLEEFQEWAKKEFQSIDDRFQVVQGTLADLNKDRWINYGKSALVYGLFVTLVEFALHKTLFLGG